MLIFGNLKYINTSTETKKSAEFDKRLAFVEEDAIESLKFLTVLSIYQFSYRNRLILSACA